MYMTVFGTEFGTCDASILGTVKDGPGTMILLRGRERKVAVAADPVPGFGGGQTMDCCSFALVITRKLPRKSL